MLKWWISRLVPGFLLALVIPGGVAHAQLSVVGPTSPIIYFNIESYSLKYTGTGQAQLSNVQFRWQQTGSCNSAWSAWTAASGSSGTVSYYENIPGTFTVQGQATVSVFNYKTNPPTVTTSVMTASTTVKVLPPDGIILPTNANGTPATFTTQCQGGMVTQGKVPFVVTCTGQRVNVAGGTPKETLTNRTGPTGPTPDGPPVSGDPSFLYCSGNSIIDVKSFSVGGGANVQQHWNSIANGTTVLSATEQLYLQIPDACGVVQTYSLSPAFKYHAVKTNQNTVTWTIGE